MQIPEYRAPQRAPPHSGLRIPANYGAATRSHDFFVGGATPRCAFRECRYIFGRDGIEPEGMESFNAAPAAAQTALAAQTPSSDSSNIRESAQV